LSKNNVDWSEKYLLPSSFGNTSLNEVYGCVFGEEAPEANWWVEDKAYHEENEGERINVEEDWSWQL